MNARVATVGLLPTLLLLGGCCSGVGGTLKLDQRLEADLSTYQVLGVKVTSSNSEWQEGVDQFRTACLPKVQGVVGQTIDLSTGASTEADLLLEVKVIDFRAVSSTMRFWLGIFAGQSRLIASVTLRDAAGTVLGQGAVGAYSEPRGCTKMIIEHAAGQLNAFMRGGGELVGGGG